MQILALLAYVFAFVLFCIAALNWAPTSANWYRLLAAGLACMALGHILSGVGSAGLVH